MDKELRDQLASTTLAIRRMLEDEFARQLEGVFDIFPDGRINDRPSDTLTPEQQFTRAKIVASIVRRRAKGEPQSESVYAYMRESAFTFLNRLAAFKMMEARGLVLECVSRGPESSGFKEFCGLAPGLATLPDKGYQLYLESLFDEIGREVGALFTRSDSSSLLWPSRRALEGVLSTLNEPSLANVWAGDETIGWIYQYYNDPAERKKMREESAAPRNSRELAVRNQFFTPRYVVEFLTDNTLGRIWYEMTQGGITLKEQCRYLVRRPNEIFLKPGESAPEQPKQDNLSQKDLLKQPVFIPHRPLKDPRTILMLDPACGSMHFGLYAFDLFEVIYDEAWALEEKLGADALSRPPGMKSLHDTYAAKDAFLKDVPRHIIEHNLHGIDIDPRCAQIAGLSLWLRAQKAWQRLGLKPAERPAIKRSNIVCAEPMPGEKELLREFVEREFPTAERAVCLRLLEAIFDKMQLAGEAGSLLKIEEEIRSAIEDARGAWRKLASRPPELFTTAELNQLSIAPELTGLEQAVSSLTTDPRHLTTDFWESIEERIYAALRDYAEQTENGGGFQRRLFAEDAARGFAFIDICKKLYDVALMNPPFGDASLPSKPYIEETYGDTKGDVYKAFVECFHARLVPAGYLGIISSRTGFYLSLSEDWRTRVVLRRFRPIALADLGMGVLDAMVEVAAYVLRNLSSLEARELINSIVPVLGHVVRDSQDRFSLPKWQAARGGLKRHQAATELVDLEAQGFVQRSTGDIVRYAPIWHSVNQVTAKHSFVYPPLVCIRALMDADKGAAILEALAASASNRLFVATPTDFSEIPGSPFAYWVGPRIRKLFTSLHAFESSERAVRVGLQTSDDFRFVRAWWEVSSTSLNAEWIPFAKGGSTRSVHSQLSAVINWKANGAELKARAELTPGTKHWSRNIRSTEHYFKPGITWPKRASRFSPQAMPRGCIFSIRGQTTIAPESDLPWMLAIMASVVFDALFKTMLGRFGFPEFATGILQRMPWPNFSAADKLSLTALSAAYWQEMERRASSDSLSHSFVSAAMLRNSANTLTERAATWAGRLRLSEKTVAAIQTEIDDFAVSLYGLNAADRAALISALVTESTADVEDNEAEEEEAATADAFALTADFLAYALGCAFGRWDIRHVTGEKTARELSDPFAPLPVCSLGQLQNAQGMPVRPEDVPVTYPVRIPWNGILVDDPNHPLDLERRVREVIEIIWTGSAGGPTAEAIEHEACEILGVKSLRDYFRKPAGFFADHLKRYSKSSRQAPIYWPLASPKRLYSVWLYYHRLTTDTFFTLLREVVKPRLDDEDRHFFNLKQAAGPSPTPSQVREIGASSELTDDLRAFHDEVQRIAPLWKPNLNDGVIINHAPLWRLAPHAAWRKSLKETWDVLCAGKYDWSHLSFHLWPERVIAKCATDRSLAIAHELDAFFWVEDPKSGKWISRKRKEADIRTLIAERSSPAVKAALESLLTAPAPSGGTAKKGRKAKTA